MSGVTLNGGDASGKNDLVGSAYKAHMQGSPAQNAFVASKTKEDIFLKNNLEYEQRLKHHLYQFEEERNKNGSIDDSVSDRQESRAFNRETPGGGEGTSQMAGHNQPTN